MTYVEVFCAVFVVYLIWMMYFTGFDARHWMGRRRIWAWTVLHMPLHFVTMLLNQGMVVSFPGSSISLRRLIAIAIFRATERCQVLRLCRRRRLDQLEAQQPACQSERHRRSAARVLPDTRRTQARAAAW